MSKIREKESLECGRMHIWALKTQKLPEPLSRPWTPPQIARFARATPLCYVGNFRPQHLGPPPWPNPGSAPVYSQSKVTDGSSLPIQTSLEECGMPSKQCVVNEEVLLTCCDAVQGWNMKNSVIFCLKGNAQLVTFVLQQKIWYFGIIKNMLATNVWQSFEHFELRGNVLKLGQGNFT